MQRFSFSLQETKINPAGMRYTIYFGDSPLHLTDTLDSEMTEIMHHDDGVFMDELSNRGVKSMIHEMKDPQRHAGVFFHAELDELKKAFWRNFTVIQAAGGLVRNDTGELLMILRRGKWDLPKGKLDKGESLEACALREVEEETGIRGASLIAPVAVTYHVYDEFGKHILKESHWFSMHAPGVQHLQPQAEEQITSIEWAGEARRRQILPDAYPLIRDLLRSTQNG
jgi:8-oxo-dGTP pyrophosphatase MutT (NUDIX family)